jgi:hypothetical protein
LLVLRTVDSEILVITFPPELGGATRNFENPKELRKWIGSERDSLREFGESQNNSFLWRDSPGSGKGWATVPTLNQLDGHCNDWERDVASPGQHQRNGLKNARNAASAYASGQAISSDSSAIHAIRKYRERGYTREDVIGFGLAILKQPLIDAARYYRGFIHGTIAATESLPFADGDRERVTQAAQESERIQGELEALARLQEKRVEDATADWLALVGDAKEATANQLAAGKAELEQFSKQYETVLKDLDDHHEAAIAACDKDIEDFKARLKTEIALGFPIDHWKKKATYHNIFFWGSLAAFVLLAAAFVVLIYWQGSNLMNEIEAHEVKVANTLAPVYGPTLPGTPVPQASGSARSGLPLHFLRLGILVLSVTLGLWFLRFVARILLSSLHLRDDATERVVMIKTFLAFNEAKVGLSPEDVKLALASVFRPATSGLVSDDGIPPGIWDAITRLKQ